MLIDKSTFGCKKDKLHITFRMFPFSCSFLFLCLSFLAILQFYYPYVFSSANVYIAPTAAIRI